MLLLTIISCVSVDNDTGKESFTDSQNNQENIDMEQETQSEDENSNTNDSNSDSNSNEEEEETNNTETGEENPEEEDDSVPSNTGNTGSIYDAITTFYSIPSSGSSGTTNITSVSMPSGIISDVNVLISIEHTCIKDLSARLMSPNGTDVALFDLSGMVVCSSDIESANFDDESTLSLGQGSGPFSGSFLPIGSLSDFDGENASGEWNLTIIDNTPGDSGKLTKWSFEFVF